MFGHHALLRPNSASRRDMLTDHAIELIEEGGLAAVTVPAIARRIGLTRQAITQWVGGSRSDLLELVTCTYSQRWRQWLESRLAWHGALTFLPTVDEDVRWVRIRLALEELERTIPDCGLSLREVRSYERELFMAIHPALSVEGAEDRLAALFVLLDGLRVALCQPIEPWAPDTARRVFWSECVRVAGEQAEWLSPHAPWGPSQQLLAGKQPGRVGSSQA